MQETRKVIYKKKKGFSLEEYFKTGFLFIVDDHQNMRRTIRNMLKQLGIYDVHEAEDGDIALNKLKRLKDEGLTCRFILLDWNMPRMPGIQVIREIRSGPEYVGDDYRDIPVVMITAEANQDQIAQAGEIGVNGYLIKPFVALTLEERIAVVVKNKLNPPDNVKLIHAGEKMVKEGNYEKALAVFNEARKIKDNARVMLHIGETFKKTGNMDAAIKSFQIATDKNPGFLKAHTATAEIHLELGNEDAALEALDRANDISPNNSDRQFTAGKLHLKKGDEEKAQAAFDTVMQNDPAKSSEIAEEFLKAGKAKEAEVFFRKSLEKNADNVHVYNRLGIALRRQGKWKAAIEEYNKAIVVDPMDSALHFNLAKAYLEGGKHFEAQSFFQKALKIDPELEEAKKELQKMGAM